jgi:hypothetical protein
MGQTLIALGLELLQSQSCLRYLSCMDGITTFVRCSWLFEKIAFSVTDNDEEVAVSKLIILHDSYCPSFSALLPP